MLPPGALLHKLSSGFHIIITMPHWGSITPDLHAYVLKASNGHLIYFKLIYFIFVLNNFILTKSQMQL